MALRYLSDRLSVGRIVLLRFTNGLTSMGGMIEAWASINSFREKSGRDKDENGPGRNTERCFHKEKRSNQTHASMTDPEARLCKKGDSQPSRVAGGVL